MLQTVGRIARWIYRLFAATCVGVVVVALVVLLTPAGALLETHLMSSTPLEELPQADAIVCLGGDLFRAADALRVYRAGKAPLIILSGEAEEALPIVEAGQVPRSAIRVDTAPERTMDHPRTIKSIEGIDESSRLILISSALQQRRALNIFRDAGYDQVWVCSFEWELHQEDDPDEEEGLALARVARVMYETGARMKSWVIDR